jgi:hypothetical protein
MAMHDALTPAVAGYDLFLASVPTACARGLSSYAATRLLAANPSLATRDAPLPYWPRW